jgi:nitrate/nitrite-specific signal transduction histidine kinase
MKKEKPVLSLSSIQIRLGIPFLLFLLILVVSVIVTFYGIEIQSQDARTINLAGRQRMLLQQMSSLAFGYALETEQGSGYKTALLDTISEFDGTLNVMRNGGEIRDYTGTSIILPRAVNPGLILSLEDVAGDWEIYQKKILGLLSSSDARKHAGISLEIEDLTPAIIAKADQVVQRYEDLTRQKLLRLRVYQLSFLGSGLLILGLGWWITRKAVVQPLGQLEHAARRIGAGQLETAIQAVGSDEVKILGETLDQMRAQILASQLSLNEWAQTLEDRVAQRTRELEALASVSSEITSHLALSEVLNSVAQKARELSGAEVASLCLLDEYGRVLNLHAINGPHNTVKQMHSSVEHPMIGRVLNPACVQACELQACAGACQILDQKYLTSHIAVSLRSKNKVIGALCIGSQKSDAFHPEIKTLLGQLAGVTAVALENSRLYLQAETLATFEERQRMTAEMHDGSLQTLSFLRLMARWAKEQVLNGELQKATNSILQVERAGDQIEQEIRQAIASLQDEIPLNFTFQEQLAVLVAELTKSEAAVNFKSETLQPILLDIRESEQALRIVREAVTNAQKYSGSQAINVTLSYNEDSHQISLKIKDLGVGFNPQEPKEDGRPHFGLKIMQARAARLGGQFVIHSAENSGTEAIISWCPISLNLQTKEA